MCIGHVLDNDVDIIALALAWNFYFFFPVKNAEQESIGDVVLKEETSYNVEEDREKENPIANELEINLDYESPIVVWRI